MHLYHHVPRHIVYIATLLILLVHTSYAGTLSRVGTQQWVVVQHVYDGDTFKTTRGEKVRLLGINTPEVMHDTQPSEPLGESARLYLQQHITGQTVRLEYDQQRKDIYGRTLAHVYLSDGTWINQALVQKGLAHVYTFAPNVGKAAQLLFSEHRPIDKQSGIWGVARFKLLQSTDVNNQHIGQFRIIQGNIARTDANGWGFQFANVHISIPRKYRELFKQPPFPKQMQGSTVRVRGTIRVSKNGLYLALHSPFDLEHIHP